MQRRHFTASLLAPLGAAFIAGAAGPTLVSAREPMPSGKGVARQLADIEAASGGRLGVSILDTATGWRVNHRPNERFPMCSTFKFLLAAATLQRVDRGEERLDRRIPIQASDLIDHSPTTGKHVGPHGLSVAEMCEATMTLSDNAAANLLLPGIGGPAGQTRFLRAIGDPLTRLDRTEPGLNEGRPGDPRDTTTPAAMVDTMRKILLGNVLKPASREQILEWLVANQTGDRRLRAGLPSDWVVGDKTGSGNGTTNDIAILRPPGRGPILVTAYLTESPKPDAVRSSTLAEVGAVVAGAFQQA